MRKWVGLAAALSILAIAPGLAEAQGGAACDRRCLLRTLTTYTEALTDDDVSRLPLAADVRTTANGVVTPLGKSEPWGAGRRLPYRQAFVDPITGSAVFYGILTTAARPGSGAAEAPAHWWFYVARLKLRNRKISEVEEIAYEKPPGGFS